MAVPSSASTASRITQAASMKGLPLEMKKYLRLNKLPDVYEALLTGLAVMCPDDPLQFILDKLRGVKEGEDGLDRLQWDMFVDEFMKPKDKIITESNLDFIFNIDDESSLPTPEMYATAYGHYNNSLKKMCFSAWIQFFLIVKRKNELLKKRFEIAYKHYSHRMLKLHLHVWRDWVHFRKGRQAMAFHRIQFVYHVAIGRVIFEAWHNHTLEARRQREYFEDYEERLERGENMDEDDVFGQGTGEARDSISLLPRKVAVLVFMYLDVADLARCACVCRSWKVITQASILWNKIDFHRVRNRVTDKVATTLLYKSRPYLRHLNVRCCSNLGISSFVTISECRNIQDLNMSECAGLTDETFKVIAKGCKILLYLNVSHTTITDATLRTISKYCSNLQYLSLAFCKKFSDRGLQYLSTGKCNTKLEYLDLSACLQITPDGFRNLASGCENLGSLIINEFPTLLDECINAVAEKCTRIHTISFIGSPLLTDEPFKKLAHHRKLKKIRIEGNHRISDASMKLIGKCPNMEHIYAVDCQRLTDATLKHIAGCKNLTVLNIADCVRISDTGVRHLCDSAMGACAARIRELNLTNCVRVGDMAMVNIHKRCPNMTYMNVSFCEHISEAGIELLGQTHSIISLDISGCNCGDQGLIALGNNSRLKTVILSECAGVTDLGLQKFAQQCRDIERLDISHCMQITDGAIKNLAFCCRMLNVLNVAGCKLITDLSIQYLSGVCHYLIQLDISGCILITDKALKYLRKGCKKLRQLVMLYCKGISKHSAQKMMRHVEKIQFNNDEVPSFFNY